MFSSFPIIAEVFMAFFVLNALIMSKKLSFNALFWNLNSILFSLDNFDDAVKSSKPKRELLNLVTYASYF